jgi:hypothetical protein
MSELGKYVATEVSPIKEGQYEGRITDIKRDTENYDYTRYQITLDFDKSPTLTVSYPSNISFLSNGKPSSQHAEFLSRMKIPLKDGRDLSKDISGLLGKKVTLLVQQKETDRGTFSEIVKESVKLV